MAAPRSNQARRRTRSRVARNPNPAFDGLFFGSASARDEVVRDPDRFARTYFDRWDLPRKVASHEKFLLLGPKGSGKTAAASFVSLTWQKMMGEEKIIQTFIDFDELNRTQTPLTQLDRKLVSPELYNLTDAAWRLFIGVRLMDSLMRDASCSLGSDPQVIKLIKELQASGLASDDYPKVLRSVRSRKGFLRVPKVVGGEISSQETENLSPGQLGDALIRLVLNCATSCRHLLAIDGLDKAIGSSDAYWETLAALVRVVERFRLSALEVGNRSMFIVVMCRSDVFRRARFADAPSIAADGGVYMEWHAEAADPRQVLLWDYLGRKAEISADQVLNFLPPSVAVGKMGGVPTAKYLLEFTRYTPRDMSLLFRQLQDEVTAKGRLTGPAVRAAADRFATQNLLSELMAEAVGLLDAGVSERLDSVISSLPSRIVRKRDLDRSIQECGLGDSTDARALGEYLFLQGALGNYRPDSKYVQFYHRRDVYKFDPSGPWVLHTGLVYAMNVKWEGI